MERFSKVERLGRIAGLCAALACLCAGCGDSGPAAPGPDSRAPTIVLVTLDTTRADRLGAYGHADARTPRLDALAQRGRLFTHAWTPAPITLPAHASLLTGTWPNEHGVRDNSVFRLEDSALLVSEVLAEAGYRSGAFVGAYVLDPVFGLDQGFERFTSPLRTQVSQGPDVADRPCNLVIDDALRWLRTVSRNEPLFLWAHLFDPHAPYEPPPPYDTLAHPYDGEIAFADAQLGRLLDVVERRRGDGPLLVVVTADHGEAFGAHGEPSHGIFVYEPTMRIPLIAAGDGVAPGRDSTPVSLVDVAPALLRWAGLDADALPDQSGIALPGIVEPQGPGHESSGREGPSAQPPAASHKAADRPLSIETYMPHYAHGWHPLRGLVWQGYKYIEANQRELYHLAGDPGETQDLSAADPARADAMSARLAAFVEQHPPLDTSVEHEPDEEALRRLAALGYVFVERNTNALDPGQPDPRERIGELAVLQQALSALRRGRWLAGLDSDSPSVDGPEGQARKAQGLALLQEVRDTFAALVEANPDNLRYRGHLGFAELSRGHPVAAIAQFQRVAQDDFDPAVTHFNLGSAYAAAGDLDRARQEMEAVIGFDASFDHAYLWLARHHEGRGEFGPAAAWRRHQERTWRGSDKGLALVRAERTRLAAAARAAGQPVDAPTPGGR